MNIFARVIYTSNNDIKQELIKSLNLTKKDNLENIEIYSKLDVDSNIVLIFEKDIKKTLDFLVSNYEVINFFYIWTSLPIDDLDLKFGDIIIPNTFINEENEAIFVENLVMSNYDLNGFWLILNGICVSIKNKLKDNEQLEELKKLWWEIMDYESFNLVKWLKENNLIDKSIIIKIVWEDIEYIKNAKIILDIML